MPQVSQMLMKDSGMEPNLTVSADEAIAQGAAIYAQTRGKNELKPKSIPPIQISDVTSHNLCVLGVDNSTGLKRNHVMIERNSLIPTAQTTRFETVRDNQRSVVVKVVEGGDSRGRHGILIGKCILRDLPPDMRAGTPVDVTFRYDSNGLIHVQAELPATNQTSEIHIDRDYGHSQENLESLRDIHLALGLDEDA